MGSRPAGVPHKHSQTCDLDKSLWQQESLDKEKGGSLSLIESCTANWHLELYEVRGSSPPLPPFCWAGSYEGVATKK